jgi:1-acyl-sn-glycerol-3-phosphate acyltransferase
VAAQLGTIFIDRESFADLTRVNAAVEQALARGLTVVFFPEATTTHGDSLLPFRSPLLEPAARSGRPVYYAALHYATPPGAPPARDHVAWGGVVSLREHVLRLMALPGFTATVIYGASPVTDPNRKSLARTLSGAVAALFRPL